MPSVRTGTKKEAATPAAKSELEQMRELLQQAAATITDLKAQVAARPTHTTGNRVYPEPGFPREAVDELLAVGELSKEEQAQAISEYKLRKSAKDLCDIRNLFVKRIPGSPTSETEPFGKAVLVWNKAHTTQMNAMKDFLRKENGQEDRDPYIKLGNLIDQMQGDIKTYKKPRQLTEEQINGVLRPILDVALKNDIISL